MPQRRLAYVLRSMSMVQHAPASIRTVSALVQSLITDFDIGTCSQKHCYNGGSCVSESATSCYCPLGFAGARCEKDLCHGHCIGANSTCHVDDRLQPQCRQSFLMLSHCNCELSDAHRNMTAYGVNDTNALLSALFTDDVASTLTGGTL